MLADDIDTQTQVCTFLRDLMLRASVPVIVVPPRSLFLTGGFVVFTPLIGAPFCAFPIRTTPFAFRSCLRRQRKAAARLLQWKKIVEFS